MEFFDYLGVTRTSLSDFEREILKTFWRWGTSEQVQKEIENAAWERRPAMGLWKEMARMDVFRAHIPEEYGGVNLDNVSYGLMMVGLEAGNSALRSCASVQNALVCYPIHAFGSEEQKRKWLPDLASGDLVGAFGLTEPNHGSDPGGMETRAVRNGDSYVLNGSKQWITNAEIADLFVVWARMEGEVWGFLVEKGTPGLEARPMSKKDSLQAGATGEFFLADCRVPAESLMPNSRGLLCALRCLNEARYGIAWGMIGAAAYCLQTARDYCLSRTQFGEPIAAFQLVQSRLADMATDITLGFSGCVHLGRLRDRNEAKHHHVSMMKRNNCRVARRSALAARELLGANGVSAEYPIMLRLKDIESVYTYEGTDDMHTLIVGEALTGIPAYRRVPSSGAKGH